MKIATIIISHHESLSSKWLSRYPDIYVFHVGSSPHISHPRVIIARDLPFNIEDQPRLLTFTAWYAISKNLLFPDYDYVLLLEYDVELDSLFFKRIKQECNNHVDVIAFMGGTSHFMKMIDHKTLDSYLELKNMYYDSSSYWYYTTNMVVKRSVLDSFVDWYDYNFILEKDPIHISWYHERLFSVFCQYYFLHVTQLTGVHHLFLRSHAWMQDVNQ